MGLKCMKNLRNLQHISIIRTVSIIQVMKLSDERNAWLCGQAAVPLSFLSPSLNHLSFLRSFPGTHVSLRASLLVCLPLCF